MDSSLILPLWLEEILETTRLYKRIAWFISQA